MSKDDVVKHAKQFSKAYNSKSSPWQTDFDAMAYKTVIRQLCDKKLPKATTEHGILMNEAAHIDDFPEDEQRQYVVQKEQTVSRIESTEDTSMTDVPEYEDEDLDDTEPEQMTIEGWR